MTRSTWLHLRVPFSFYLAPVFCFALSQSPAIHIGRAVLVFAILHLLAYPASNGFNSYYDRDEGSIGGLEHPPVVSRELLDVSLALDALALGLGALFIGWRFAAMLASFGLASKAYSHPTVRLKRRPWAGWLTVFFFQGGFTYAMIVVGLADLRFSAVASSAVMVPAVLSSLMFGGAFPMTQIYQHAEDARRGDRTLSRVLGLRGTFGFSGLMLTLALAAFFAYFESIGRQREFYVVLAFMAPAALYGAAWFLRVLRDPTQANFRSTMMLSRISATALISCFLLLTWENRPIRHEPRRQSSELGETTLREAPKIDREFPMSVVK